MTYLESKRAVEELVQSKGWEMVAAAVKSSIEAERRLNDSGGAGDFWKEAERTARIRGTIAGLRTTLEIPDRIMKDLESTRKKEIS